MLLLPKLLAFRLSLLLLPKLLPLLPKLHQRLAVLVLLVAVEPQELELLSEEVLHLRHPREPEGEGKVAEGAAAAADAIEIKVTTALIDVIVVFQKLSAKNRCIVY